MIDNPEINIRQIRELKNISQDFIAKKLGISTRAYSKIETGETQLHIKRLNEISEILEVPPLEILGFDDKQVFNHCKQEGNIGINNNYTSDKMVEQYENRITHLEGEILFLRNQLESK
jgi:transcriptional regulator with XRE-family HTH domain